MKYLPNWDKTQSRHAAFWNGTLTGACLHSVTAPVESPTTWNTPYDFPDDADDRKKWWTDSEIQIKRHRHGFENTYFGGDAFPVMSHNLGPAGLAGFFEGAIPRFGPSIWYAISLMSYADLKFDPTSLMYQKSISMAEEYVRDSQGDYIVAFPDTTGIADTLSALRGPEQFMTDLLDRPDEVQNALRYVQDIWKGITAKIYDIVRDNNYGGSSIGWLQTWASGFHGQLQCDMSVMVSPKMFDEFCMYEMREQTRALEYSLYHFDGEAQLMHLDQMLSVEELDCIQWTNVVGQGAAIDYIPVLQKIQAAGKRLLVSAPAEHVKQILDNLDASKLYLGVWANTPAEADEICKKIEKYSRNPLG